MAPNHLSFGEQAMRYFNRPHDAIRREVISSPAAWRGIELRQTASWIEPLSTAEVDDIERAADLAEAAGTKLDTIRREDFPLPVLARRIADWIEELRSGRGFVLLRGLPVERWSYDRAALVYWALGLHLGEPGAQNPQGDLLGHVVDLGEEASSPYVRRYRTAGNIDYHCDLADVVGLLCLQTPLSGGASRIVSSVTVYNELLRRRPDLIDRLYEPFCLDTRNEEGDSNLRWILVPPCRFASGKLRTFYHSDYYRSAQRYDDVPTFTEREAELLDLYEEIASDPSLYLDMQFERGDIQLLSNHFALHARTGYVDHPEPERKRHLLRLWLSLDQESHGTR